MNKQWEYREITNSAVDAPMLVCAGSEGWELVSVIPTFVVRLYGQTYLSDQTGHRYFFKREIVPEFEFGPPK